MQNQHIKKVVIAGGGTAGWAAAVALSKQLGALLEIALVESDDIGTVGVGEASIPPMRSFHRLSGIDEQEFMRETQATFKLGIQFENWGDVGESYIHSFGQIGKSTWLAEFQHVWLHAKQLGFAGSLDNYCFELMAAKKGKFAIPEKGSINYAYHFDAGLYARFLRNICVQRGVKRIEGKIAQVKQNSSTGYIESLVLESGMAIEGDLFIDCTGFRALLIEKALHTPYEDWSHWLPTDSAYALQTQTTSAPVPLTRSIARGSGWQWKIPLQHRVGNGWVYCSEYQNDDSALQELLEHVDGEVLTEPRLIKYRTGRRKKVWNKNCVALGLSSGFLEPLESTSIYLMMIGVSRLIQMFPSQGIKQSQVDHYNQVAQLEMERIRDFIILHYKVTKREDTPFWVRCKNQAVPDSLRERIELFKETAHVYQADGDLFQLASWLQVMLGQGLYPDAYHPLGQLMSEGQLKEALGALQANISGVVERMPLHADFVSRYCPAPQVGR